MKLTLARFYCRLLGHKLVTTFKGTKADAVFCVRCHENLYRIH